MMLRMQKLADGSLIECDEDEAGLCTRVRVPMLAMDSERVVRDDNKLAAGEAKKQAAWQRMCARVEQAWKGQQTQEPPKGTEVIGGTENYIGSSGRITTIARSTT